jgi:nucleoside-diphosphate-sugar epimerase
MKTALIIGATGNFGFQMALTLLNRGWQLKILIRDKDKCPGALAAADIIEGSANDSEAVLNAAHGCALIVYAANPKYHRWQQEALAMLEPTIAAAKVSGARILLPGNVYNYSPQPQWVNELTQQLPYSKKGEIRVEMEQRLKQASQHGVKTTIIRAGDFIGPNTHFTWLNMALRTKGKQSKLSMPHDQTHKHFWSYLPDLCINAAQLVESSEATFEVWHDVGLQLTTQEWVTALQQNGQIVKQSKFPWLSLTFASLFSPMLKEVIKMRYLWQKPIILDGEKMKEKLGSKREETQLADVVKAILAK